jgi:prepilin-type N-terminal cleavage/methylation domain-containing protein
MKKTGRARRGSTLIELLVVLMILSTLTGVAALAIRRVSAPDPADPWVRIAATRRRVVTSGKETTIVIVRAGVPLSVSFLSDGRTLADSALHLDPLTGRRLDEAR